MPIFSATFGITLASSYADATTLVVTPVPVKSTTPTGIIVYRYAMLDVETLQLTLGGMTTWHRMPPL